MESEGHTFVFELNGCPAVYVCTRTEQGNEGDTQGVIMVLAVVIHMTVPFTFVQGELCYVRLFTRWLLENILHVPCLG